MNRGNSNSKTLYRGVCYALTFYEQSEYILNPHSCLRLSYLSSLRIFSGGGGGGGGSGFCTPVSPLSRSPPPEFLITSPDFCGFTCYFTVQNYLFLQHAVMAWPKPIDQYLFAQNDHRRRLRRLSQTMIIVDKR